jgi:hypothetical protein
LVEWLEAELTKVCIELIIPVKSVAKNAATASHVEKNPSY